MGKHIRIYPDPKSDKYESNIYALAYIQMKKNHWEPLEGPVKAKITIYRKLLKTSKKKIQLMIKGYIIPATKPDLDNQVKSILDALNGVAFKDDGQISDISAKKRYDDGKGERVEVILELKKNEISAESLF